MESAVAEYNEHRSGPLTSSHADAVAFQKLVNDPIANLSAKAKQDLAWVPDDFPDVEYVSFGTYNDRNDALSSSYKFQILCLYNLGDVLTVGNLQACGWDHRKRWLPRRDGVVLRSDS